AAAGVSWPACTCSSTWRSSLASIGVSPPVPCQDTKNAARRQRRACHPRAARSGQSLARPRADSDRMVSGQGVLARATAVDNVKQTQGSATSPSAAAGLAPPDYCDPVIEAYKKDVDRTLLRENLKLTVQERFEKFERFMEYVDELRAAGQRARRVG